MCGTSGNNNADVIIYEEWRVYCFLTARLKNHIREWLEDEKVAKAQRTLLQQKIDTLESGGPDVNPGIIFGPIVKDIYKMKVKGNKGHIQLRPMLCRGPHGQQELTLLRGAVERDGKLDPKDAPTRAQENRSIVVMDRTRRRRESVA